LIEDIMEEVVEESSMEDPLEACFAQFGEDLDLDKLLEQADAMLETTPLVRGGDHCTQSSQEGTTAFT
jgi:hypothetical protein